MSRWIALYSFTVIIICRQISRTKNFQSKVHIHRNCVIAVISVNLHRNFDIDNLRLCVREITHAIVISFVCVSCCYFLVEARSLKIYEGTIIVRYIHFVIL